MTEDRSNAMTLGALGMLSGAVAWALLEFQQQIGLNFDFGSKWFIFLPLSIYPGLVFGLVVGALLYRLGKVDGLGWVGYLFAAGLAYLCAFHVAFHADQAFFPPGGERVVGSVASGIPAGLVGSLLLGLVTIHLLRVPARMVLRWPVVVGGAAGALLGITTHDHTEWGWTLLAFFVLWQGAYAASLAPILRPALAPPWERGLREASQSPPAPESE